MINYCSLDKRLLQTGVWGISFGWEEDNLVVIRQQIEIPQRLL